MIIRKACEADAATIAPNLVSAMTEIVYGFIGSNDSSKAADLMFHFVKEPNNQYSYENCWVAEINGEVVGAANVYDGAKFQELRQPVLDYLRTNFRNDFVPADETQAGELYVDSIGVNPNKRGNGIGSALLQFLIDEYAMVQHKTLGLLVDPNNPRARQLYLKMGFVMVSRKNIFGKEMEHLQMVP